MLAKSAAHQIEDAGARLRAMTPWISTYKLVDKEKKLDSKAALAL